MKTEIEYLIEQLKVDLEWSDKKNAIKTTGDIEAFFKTGKIPTRQVYS